MKFCKKKINKILFPICDIIVCGNENIKTKAAHIFLSQLTINDGFFCWLKVKVWRKKKQLEDL